MTDYNPKLEVDGDEWVTEKDIQEIVFARQMDETLTAEQLSRKLQRDHLPAVTMGVIKLAKFAPDPRIRLQASTYLMDRVLGKSGIVVTDGDDLPADMIMDNVMKQLETMLGATGDTMPIIEH